MDLDSFIAAQREAGSLDSRGEFTVALEKARAKLREYQLADPSFYLLKIFQAGVRAGADEIHIRLGRRQVRLWFYLDEASAEFDFDRLFSIIQDVLSAPVSALRHLVVGLNASLVKDPDEVIWGHWERQASSKAVRLSGDEFEVVSDPPVPGRFWTDSRSHLYYFQARFPGGVSLFSSATSEEHTAVVQRCGFAPVKVFLDTRPIEARWQERDAGWAAGISAPFYLAERFVLDSQSPALGGQMPSLLGYHRNGVDRLRIGRGRKTFCIQVVDVAGNPTEPERGPLRARAAFALPMSMNGKDSVTVIQDGVLLESVSLEGEGLGRLALMDGSALKVDLSEFRVVRDQAYQALEVQARQQWRLLENGLLANLKYLRTSPTDAQLKQANPESGMVIAGGCLGSCLGPTLGGILFPFLMFGSMPTLFMFLGLVGGVLTPYGLKRMQIPNSDQRLCTEVELRYRHQRGEG